MDIKVNNFYTLQDKICETREDEQIFDVIDSLEPEAKRDGQYWGLGHLLDRKSIDRTTIPRRQWGVTKMGRVLYWSEARQNERDEMRREERERA